MASSKSEVVGVGEPDAEWKRCEGEVVRDLSGEPSAECSGVMGRE